MTSTPYLDIVARDTCLEDSSLISKALDELDAIYAAAPFLGRLEATLTVTSSGWVAHYNNGYRAPTALHGRYGNPFSTAEDAIAALRALIEKWRAADKLTELLQAAAVELEENQ